MSDKELMCHLRQMFEVSQADREYLESYYDGECDPDTDDSPYDNWYQGIDLGNIEAKTKVLDFLQRWEDGHM